MKREWLRVSLALALLGGVSGLLVAASGLIPIKASSGHWALTEMFLQFSKGRALATQTLFLDLPPLEEPRLVLTGAAHYETGCRPCHGSPELRSPRVARAMLPHPPDLASLVPSRSAEELFYVVKHGIKFTGMPAWPAQGRDDEVQAVVAFLLTLPGLDADHYQELVHGPGPPERESAPRVVVQSCARCHGTRGEGRGLGAFPKLAGQRREYQVAALEAYAEDRRYSGIMQPIAAGLRAEDWVEVSDYYAGRAPSAGSSTEESDAAVERGREIAERGIPAQRTPSCRDCHGPGPERRNSAYPALAGQYAEYLALQLELFKSRHRGGSSHAHLMVRVATTLSSDQMRDVARYYAAQRP
jgi:cytochrome c553